jgi:hypothetical protein
MFYKMRVCRFPNVQIALIKESRLEFGLSVVSCRVSLVCLFPILSPEIDTIQTDCVSFSPQLDYPQLFRMKVFGQ